MTKRPTLKALTHRIATRELDRSRALNRYLVCERDIYLRRSKG